MRVGRSYFLEYVLSYFCSNSLDDGLQKHIPVLVNLKNCHQAEKKAFFPGILGKCKFEQVCVISHTLTYNSENCLLLYNLFDCEFQPLFKLPFYRFLCSVQGGI